MSDPTPTAERFEPAIPLDAIIRSKSNPREHFDDAHLHRLAESIKEKGVIQPIIVRPVPRNGHFELVAGECRFRASKIAEKTTIPAIVRTLTDGQVREFQLIENIHRQDLTALEQAKGYRALIDSNPTKHSAESIAKRIGMSPAWVWDRMKLNDLVAEAKKLLAADRISVGHAILIARLKPEDQKRVVAPGNNRATYSADHERRGGLWQHEEGLPFEPEGRRGDPYYGLKPVTVRELQHWIDDHVRFDVDQAAKAAPLEFGDLPGKIETREAQPGRGRKVIAITHNHFTQPEARDENDRTYGPQSWKQADGTKGHPTCPHAVLGVVAVGEDRGQALDVCVARDKCEVHWKKEVAEKKKREKAKKSGKTLDARKLETVRQSLRDEQERQKREAKETRWKAFYPALRKAVFEATDKVGATLSKPVYAKMLAANSLPPTTKPAGLAKALLVDAVRRRFRDHAWDGDEPAMRAWATVLKVDVKACEPKPAASAAPVQTSGVNAVVWHALGRKEGGHGRVNAWIRAGTSTADLDKLLRNELGDGGYLGEGFDYRTKNGQLHINKPMKKKLTVGKVRLAVQQILAAARAR